MARTIWEKSQGSSSPPGDLPAGRYEWRFTVNGPAATAAIGAFWTNKADTLHIDLGGGQTFSPVAIWQDRDNTAGTEDLVLLADVTGFWPQLLGIALAAIGISVALAVLLREIRLAGATSGGQLALMGGGLLLIALVLGGLYFFVKSRGRAGPA
jgi:hypothetical protein